MEQTLKMVINTNLRTGLGVRDSEAIQFCTQLHPLQLIFEPLWRWFFLVCNEEDLLISHKDEK